MNKETFAKRLRYYRDAKGFSRPELSQRTGVGVRVLESWEQGRREPGAFDLQRVAVALDVTIWHLVSDDAPDPPE